MASAQTFCFIDHAFGSDCTCFVHHVGIIADFTADNGFQSGKDIAANVLGVNGASAHQRNGLQFFYPKCNQYLR